MKIGKEARRATRKLFRDCFQEGRLDESRVRSVVSAVAQKKPRHYLGILEAFEKLLRNECRKSSLLIETSTPIEESQLREIQSQAQARFAIPITATHRVNSGLIGGIRLKIGSDVWDGSIAARLRQLENPL